jgi:hypothetical protein
MKYRTCLAYMTVVGCLAGGLTTKAQTVHQEQKVDATDVIQTRTNVSVGDGHLKVEVGLSTNIVAVGGSVLITVKLTNSSTTDVAIDRNTVTASISVADSKEAPITELPFMDMIYAPAKTSPLIVPHEGSAVVRVFGAQVTRGSWEGFGTSGKHEGIAFVLQRDAGASCYPLKTVPGEYALRCHLRIQALAGAGDQPVIEIVSDKLKLTVRE